VPLSRRYSNGVTDAVNCSGDGLQELRGKVAVAVLSGGNIDPELFSRLVA
jgi:threonine dehydratase